MVAETHHRKIEYNGRFVGVACFRYSATMTIRPFVFKKKKRVNNMNFRWPYEKVYEIAKTCKTRAEFKYKCKPAYEAAHRWHYFDREDWDWFEDGVKKFAESRRKWNHETVMEEAKKYTCKKDFADGAPGAYDVARENGWLDEMDWFETFGRPRGYWDYEHCYEEAKKYKTRSELMRQSGSCYNVALKNDWVKDYTWLDSGYVDRGYWTYDRCYEAAKKFTNKKDFSVQNHKAYDAAFRNSWLQDYVWMHDNRIDISHGDVDSVYVYEFLGNVIYVGRTLVKEQKNRQLAHRTNPESAVYRYAKENNIDVPPMKIILNGVPLATGVEQEIYWTTWYKEHGWTVLNVAPPGSIGGLGKGTWSKKRILEKAHLYTSLKEFRENDRLAYNAANKKGMINEMDWLTRDCKPNGYWTEERCYEVARECKSMPELRNKNSYVHRISIERGWNKNYTWMKTRRQRKISEGEITETEIS